jgi:lincosamide nucleotidyltransferase A/C/D/E
VNSDGAPSDPSAPLRVRTVRSLRRALGRVAPPGLRDSRLVSAATGAIGMLSAGAVIRIVETLHEADVAVWLAGGWGVDALAGARTRRHRDVDLVLNAGDLDRAQQALSGSGYRRVRSEKVQDALLPDRVVLQNHRGSLIDLHPVDLNAWLATAVPAWLPDAAAPARDAFATGSLKGTPLPCLSQALQLAAHEGYARRARDDHDVAVLLGRVPRQ